MKEMVFLEIIFYWMIFHVFSLLHILVFCGKYGRIVF